MMKKLAFSVLSVSLLFALNAAVVIPEVSNVAWTKLSRGRVRVTYDLSAPAVVTFDVTTNGVSIGESNIYGFDASGEPTVTGDVGRELAAGSHTFVWNARATWANHRGNAQVVVTAWPLNDKPPYMVVDISTNEMAAADRIAYYASSNAVPGGIVADSRYKTDAIVFKRIYARNRPCVQGDGASKAAFTLTNDFYLAVFETTQAQWKRIWTGKVLNPLFVRDGDGRPMEEITYSYLRLSKNNAVLADAAAYVWPNPPCPDSWLGLLRTRCGNLVDFDLPTRDEWIFAATGGYGNYYWGDGSPVTTSGGTVKTVCPNLSALGRYAKNGGWSPTSATERTAVSTNDLAHGTAIVGTYRPNAYGIYDMHGNVLERLADQPSYAAGGDCHREPSSCIAQNSLDEVQPTSASYSYSRGTYAGFRIACRNGLK